METKENRNNFSTTVTSHGYQKISYHWQQPLQENTKENNKTPHYWCLMGRNHQWPMESPHKGSAMRKTFIMQFQYFRSAYFEKTNQTQQWKHMSVLGFSLTGNSIVCSAAHTGKMQEGIKFPPYCSLTMRFYRWPPQSPKKGPAMRKALIMQFQNNRSIIDSSILRKKNQQQWYHLSISGFHITGNSIVCSIAHTPF